jgi:glutaredoxin
MKRHTSSLLSNVLVLLVFIAFGVASYFLFGKKEGFADPDKASKIAASNGVLVFTMKGCPHCVAMEDDLKTLSKESDAFAVVDSSDQSQATKDLMDKLQVNKFPTIMKCVNGSCMNYSGDRSLKSLRSLVESTQQ